MRFIRDIFTTARTEGRPVISLEFFPTKTEEGERTLLERTIPALGQLNPDFCSVTYGAGGSTRDRTLTVVDRIQREHALTTMAHLTCVNATRSETREFLNRARRMNVGNILALRGDPPGGSEFTATDDGFEYSYQLVQFIREVGDYCIGVAGFPEGHVACKEGKHVDWQRLKNKVDHGADFVITQLFFNNRDYFELRDYLCRQGVTVPVVPGIIPIVSSARSSGSSRCAERICRDRSSPNWTSVRITMRRRSSSASSTPRDSVKSCWPRASRACTSTR